MDAYPDYLPAENPVLINNKHIARETMDHSIELVPKSKSRRGAMPNTRVQEVVVKLARFNNVRPFLLGFATKGVCLGAQSRVC